MHPSDGAIVSVALRSSGIEAQMQQRLVLEGDLGGFLASRCVFDLRLHADWTLAGTVAPLRHWRRGEQASVVDDGGEDTAKTYLLFDGTVVEDSNESDPTGGQTIYTVRFQLFKRTELPGVIYVVDIVGKLSNTSGLRGRWKLSGDESRGQDFELQILIDDSNHGQFLTLKPLTDGCYTLKGVAIGENGYIYEATWHWELTSDGRVVGTSQEEDYAPQTATFQGLWTLSRVDFTMQYLVNGITGTYTYDGAVCESGLRGRWVSVDNPNSTAERGTFDFTVVEARRRWSHHSHRHFPPVFREIVTLCLLTTSRSSDGDGSTTRPHLPPFLWSEVFSYCGYHWFSSSYR